METKALLTARPGYWNPARIDLWMPIGPNGVDYCDSLPFLMDASTSPLVIGSLRTLPFGATGCTFTRLRPVPCMFGTVPTMPSIHLFELMFFNLLRGAPRTHVPMEFQFLVNRFGTVFVFLFGFRVLFHLLQRHSMLPFKSLLMLSLSTSPVFFNIGSFLMVMSSRTLLTFWISVI